VCFVRWHTAFGVFFAALVKHAICYAKFPPNFIFGAATAAYQVEGAANTGGRGPSIWDTFSHTPNKVYHNQTGDVADDQYDKYLEDVHLMSELGLDSYRFSVSWSRILPSGRPPLNLEGVKYYSDLINTLKAVDILPFVTLYHWDTPQALEDEYGGWLSESIVEDFKVYVDLCFQLFGDRVKNWITLNEPWTVAFLGYGAGASAPGRCSDRNKCSAGDSYYEPYIAGRNMLLAHAAAVSLYRQQYQPMQKGIIGITVNMEFNEPLTDDPLDVQAAEQRCEFQLGWFGDPVVFGDYPASMKRLLGDRLPAFSDDEQALLKGSLDFIGFNNYATYYVEYKNLSVKGGGFGWSDWWDSESRPVLERNGQEIGPQGASVWLRVVPRGIREATNWVYQRYQTPIYITENGVDVPGESDLTIEDALQDSFRINYLSNYIGNVSLAIADGSDVRGYFIWSLLDNFEWWDGYSKRFGIIYVNYSDLSRHPKNSYYWYKNYIGSINGIFLQQDSTSNTDFLHLKSRFAVAAVIAAVASVIAGISLGFVFRAKIKIFVCDFWRSGYQDIQLSQLNISRTNFKQMDCHNPGTVQRSVPHQHQNAINI